MAAETVLTYLDSYCERAGDVALMAEPLNLLTNGFFIFAAFFAARHMERQKVNNFDLLLMVSFLFLIGIGSGLWHAMPSGTTVLMDVIPITLFINAYIISALRRLFGLPWAKVGMWWFIYFAVGIVAQKVLPAAMLNGTVMYLPTYVTLVILTVLLQYRNAVAERAFSIALGVWTLSLVFRTIDIMVCPSLAIGTHFLWHTLNAWVLWRLLKVLIDSAAAPVKAGR